MLSKLTIEELVRYAEDGHSEEVAKEVIDRCARGEVGDVVDLVPQTPLTGQYLSGLPRPSHFYDVEPIPALGVAGTPAATAETVRLEFKGQGGVAVGFRGHVENGSIIGVGGDSVQLRLLFNDTYNVTTNGQRATFALYDDLFSTNQQTWSPLLVPFKQGDVWFHDFRNLSLVPGVRPTLTYAVLREDTPGVEVYQRLSRLWCAGIR